MKEQIFLTVPDAADLAGVASSTLRTWLKRKDDPLPLHRLPNMTKNYRVKRKELEEWLDRNAVRVN